MSNKDTITLNFMDAIIQEMIKISILENILKFNGWQEINSGLILYSKTNISLRCVWA